jgi:hypothetical protein
MLLDDCSLAQQRDGSSQGSGGTVRFAQRSKAVKVRLSATDREISVTADSAQGAIVKWLKSTPNRTFALYPAIVAAFAWLTRGGFFIDPFGVPLLAWGYLQYRLVGNYRTDTGGGGPGFQKPPERIVDTGPYRYTRNPMYLGHLIFMTGLVIAFHSWLAAAILAVNAWWFDRRVREDERALEARFGADYLAFKARVKRWIPGIL